MKPYQGHLGMTWHAQHVCVRATSFGGIVVGVVKECWRLRMMII